MTSLKETRVSIFAEFLAGGENHTMYTTLDILMRFMNQTDGNFTEQIVDVEEEAKPSLMVLHAQSDSQLTGTSFAR